MATHCPSDETLTIWTSGGIETDEAERIALHVEQCDRCASRVAEEAILFAELSSGPRKDPGPEFWASFADQIMSRVDEIPPPPPPAQVAPPSLSRSGQVKSTPVAASVAFSPRPRPTPNKVPLWRRPMVVGVVATMALATLIWIQATPPGHDPTQQNPSTEVAAGPSAPALASDLSALDSAISFLAEGGDDVEEAQSPDIAPVVALLNAPLAPTDDEASLEELSNDELATLLSGLNQVRG